MIEDCLTLAKAEGRKPDASAGRTGLTERSEALSFRKVGVPVGGGGDGKGPPINQSAISTLSTIYLMMQNQSGKKN